MLNLMLGVNLQWTSSPFRRLKLKNYNYKNKGPIIKTKFRQRLWKSSSNPRFNHEYQLFKRCFPMTVFRTVSKHWLRNNSKLDLVKNIFMVSHYEKEGPQRYRQLKAYFNRWIMYMFDKFRGTLGIDLTHKSNTATRTSPEKGLGKWTHKNFGQRSSKENARELSTINLVYLYSLHAQSFTRFQRLLWHNKDYPCHS